MTSARDLFERFGPPEKWVLPASDIEQIMRTGTCRHLLPRIADCQECFVSALLKRQTAILAERLGCTPEDARAVGEQLTREFLEER